MSTFCYMASFDLAATTTGVTSFSIATSGKTTISCILSTSTVAAVSGNAVVSTFNHYTTGLGNSGGEQRSGVSLLALSYGSTGFAAYIQASIRTLATIAGWAGTATNLTCTFDLTTLRYTFGYTATMTVTFGNSATASLFGFTGTQSGASSYVSTQLPDFIVVPTLTGCSDAGGNMLNYEPEGIASQGTSDAGVTFGLARTTVPLYRDWTQQYETKANTLRRSALSTAPFTFQELFESCRAGLPFVVINGTGDGKDEVFMLRAEGCMWKPDRASTGNDAQFHIPFKTLVQGVFGG